METHSVESNHNVEISKTTKLIREIAEAREPLDRRISILEAERRRMWSEIYENKHRQLTNCIHNLTAQIHFLEGFSNITMHTRVRYVPLPTPKELAEPIHRTKIRFPHNNKNLVEERKMGRQLREQESERQQKLQIQAELVSMSHVTTYCGPTRGRYRHPKLLPNKPLKRLIVMWADKIEQVSSLVLRDSRNLEMTSETLENLMDLMETGSNFPSHCHKIDKAEFAKHWISLKQIRNSISKIKYDLSRESRRHRKGNAESEELDEKARDLSSRLSEMYSESRKLGQEERVAIKYLSKLHKLQATASP